MSRLIMILIVFALGVAISWPTFDGVLFTIGATVIDVRAEINQGLDLQGGLQVLLEADLPEGEEVESDTLNVAATIIENRINGLGVTEPVVQRQGDRRISVELPGVEDTQQAVDLIKQTGLLEFVDVGSTPLPPGTPVVTYPAGEDPPAGTVLAFPTVMTGAELRSANATLDQTSVGYAVAFTLTEAGEEIFGAHTTIATGKFLAIVLDGEVISSPRINQPITGGQGVITGNFTIEEANGLALQLRYGSLPVPLKIVESRTVGPTLGQDSVQKSLTAGIIGLTTVAIFMVLVYRLPGVLAVLALLMYTSVTFAVFKLIPGFTLTLPGIAGFVLSIGVAVDANILIFERMKEELRDGRSVSAAIERGFHHAWSSIRDSNISTIITCFILIWFGSQFGASIVQGFAFTLLIGVVVSLLTAITATRTFLMVALSRIDLETRRGWFGV